MTTFTTTRSISDILRKRSTEDSIVGNDIKKIMECGGLVSDEFANKLVIDSIKNSRCSGFLLDGFPRTLTQAEFLYKNYSNLGFKELQVVHVKLEQFVAVAKLLGRRKCQNCGESFNLAGVSDNGYDMPPILPDKFNCILGSNCCPIYSKRDDDNEETIKNRLNEYNANIQPILSYFTTKHILKSFDVKKGIKDADSLVRMIRTEREINSR